MEKRILRFLGSSQQADITVTMGTQTVFDGPVCPGPVLFEVADFSMDFAGIVPVIITVNTGTVTMQETMVNYQPILNPKYKDQSKFKAAKTWDEKVRLIAELATPAFSDSEIKLLQSDPFYIRCDDEARFRQQNQLLYKHDCNLTIRDFDSWASVCVGESRLHVMINDHPQFPQRAPEETGTWDWTVTAGDVLSYDLKIDPAPELSYFMGKYQLPGILIDMVPEHKLKNNSKILDIGVENGQVAQELHQRRVLGEIHGLDVTVKEKFSWSKLYSNFILADITRNIPVANDTYDMAICSNVLGALGKFHSSGAWHPYGFHESEFKDYPTRCGADCVEEILRILRPTAIFVFSVTRASWPEFDLKLSQLESSGQIKRLKHSWEYHQDGYHMFPPRHICVMLEKIK
jgi:SAM-dependent methyltransferase